MIKSRFPVTILSVLIACFLFSVAAGAASLTGVWATDGSACQTVFVKSGGHVSFADNSDIYGGGFIIEGSLVRGKMQTCNIKLRKEDGEITHIVATCSTDVALSTIQFSLKFDGENKIIRFFPGVPELSTPYFRCP